jgi:hypothetical protein
MWRKSENSISTMKMLSNKLKKIHRSKILKRRHISDHCMRWGEEGSRAFRRKNKRTLIAI